MKIERYRILAGDVDKTEIYNNYNTEIEAKIVAKSLKRRGYFNSVIVQKVTVEDIPINRE